MVGGLWRVLRGELETDQRRALWWWLWCSSMPLQYHRFMQLDTIGEFLNAGDLGRLVTSCCYLLDRRHIVQPRLRAVMRCARLLWRTQRTLEDALDDENDTNEPVYQG